MPFRPYRANEDYYSPYVPEAPFVPALQKPGLPTFREGGALDRPDPTRFTPPGVSRGEQNRERFTPPPVIKPPVRSGSLSPFGETFEGGMSLSDILSIGSIPAQKNLLFSNPGAFGLASQFGGEGRGGMPGLDSFLLDASRSDDIGVFLRKLLGQSGRPGFRLKPSRLLGGRI